MPRAHPRPAATLALLLLAATPAGADFTGWTTERVDRYGLVRISVFANFDHPLDRLDVVDRFTLAEGAPVFHHRDALTQGAD